MDSKKIEIRPCPTYRSTGQDSCRRPDRVIVAEHNLTNFDKSIAKYSKSTTPVVNPHSKTTLNQAVTKAMDTLFGQGWTNRLMATGKFKVISRDEAVQIAGNQAANAKGFFNSDTDITYLVHDNYN